MRINLLFTTLSLSVAYVFCDWRLLRDFQDKEALVTEHEVRIELVQRNLETLRAINHEISDPDSVIFRNFLSAEEIKALIGQPSHVVEKIDQWVNIEKCNLCPLETKVGVHGDYVFVNSCVQRFECIFEAEFAFYTNDRGTIIRTKERVSETNFDRFGVPSNLQNYVFRIMQLAELPFELFHTGSDFSETEDIETGYEKIDPNIIRQNYGLDQYPLPIAAFGPQGSQAAVQFYDYYWFWEDLLNFQANYYFTFNNITDDLTVGKNDPNSVPVSHITEPTLDFEYLTTVEQLVTWAFTNSASFVEYLTRLAATPLAPLVQSISWSGPESKCSESEAKRVSDEFMKMTTQGFTFFISSGDLGTGSKTKKCKEFDPQFPATSPYVTAVGATYLKQGMAEKQCGCEFSGSGFSYKFSRPKYQNEAVDHYLDHAKHLPPNSEYNKHGRAIPDLSAYGYHFHVLANNKWKIVSGTSASTPVVAAMTAYANVNRMQLGFGPLGNINPTLYKQGSVGVDITCGTSQNSHCDKGFEAISGWDPASGLGTPMAETYFTLLTYS